MTFTSPVRASVVALMVFALVAVTMVAQTMSRFIAQALGASQSIRVAPQSACQLSSDGTHFTGCSSIL